MSYTRPLLSSQDMPFFFEERHRELGLTLCQKGERLDALSGQENAAAVVAACMGSELGLYRYLLPQEGQGDSRSLCLVREFLGYTSPLADAIFAVQGLGTYPIALAGSDKQKKGLDSFVRGEKIAGFALTEPEAGSDVASMQCRAQEHDGEWRLRGSKTLISNVGIAQQFVAFANARPELGRKGITAFLVQSGTEGLRETSISLSDDHPIGELLFDNCRAELLGEIGGGFALAMKTLDRFRVSVGAAAVGMARRAFVEATVHSKQRKQFGKALIEQQLVQGHLADMQCQLDAARMMVLRAAHSADTSGKTHTSQAAMAKLFATEAAQEVVDTGVQLLGGRGVVYGNILEQLYRSVRPLRIYEGTSEIQRLIIARAIAKG